MPSTNRPCTPSIIGAGLLTAALLATAACGEREPAAPTDKAAAENADPAAGKAAPGIAADDPLLGRWEVVAVVGKFEEANTGLQYDFRRDGKAHTLKYLDPTLKPSRARAAGEPPPKEGDVKRNVWSWKRVGPDRIEMTHPDSPLVARIKTTIAGDTMQFVWNETGSVFTMERIK